LAGGIGSCAECGERGSAYAEWSCAECREPRAERAAPEVWRALLGRRLIRAGLPAERTGLGFWELWFLGAIEEARHERE
jgi:alkylation response protein AidB-like acyl-CoA dehydrogenase